MDKVPDFRKSVRSMTLIPILEFLYWRMNWHLEHHMYAGVPCYNLKKLYHEVEHDMPEPPNPAKRLARDAGHLEPPEDRPRTTSTTRRCPQRQGAFAKTSPMNLRVRSETLAPKGLQ